MWKNFKDFILYHFVIPIEHQFHDPSLRPTFLFWKYGVFSTQNKRLKYYRISCLQTLRRLYKRSLSHGLTKKDLSRVKDNRTYLEIPTYKSTVLKVLKWRLECLRWPSRFIREDKLYHRSMRKVLNNLINHRSQEWVPGFVHDEKTRGPIEPSSYLYEAILYVIPSPKGINFKSPRDFIKNAKNYLVFGKRHYIGHVALELRHANKTEVLCSMTGETNLDVAKRVLFKGMGLSFLLETYPGRLEEAHEIAKDLKLHHKKRRMNFLRIPLQGPQFSQIKEYLAQFGEFGHYQQYGLWHHPLKLQGGGCASFVVAALLDANALDPKVAQKWTKTINIPSELIGPPFRKRPVSAWKLFTLPFILKKYKKWASSRKGKMVTFWDPDTISRWIEKKWNHRYRQREVYGKTKGLTWSPSYPVEKIDSLIQVAQKQRVQERQAEIS